MKLSDFLSVIDPETLVNVIDRTTVLDFGVKSVDKLYEDRFFYNNVLRSGTVRNVSAVADDRPEIQAYICILVE